ncbi:MAG: NUDIX domain-containing protein [Luteitalea sp.]|nr:NUDIX domain-containing protein [Luteitalea sp.]
MTVTAAVIQRDDTFLLTRRLAGTHLEGHWEFPGGKCEPGETLSACLLRELEEELGCRARIGECLLSTRHAYPERIVDLHFFRCELVGEAAPRIGQQMRWVPRNELRTLPLPPADSALIELLEGQQGARASRRGEGPGARSQGCLRDRA